ncbi:hypothetical protein [Bradyrhizobium iriomotense]|uniref:hypothetical protein n=1 Tax=Bradyrhizobium iriomotense TaxID=441950 RepID=UPI001B89DABC|nr:hypothetical protein [Bradyrhizobium iriomotense]MBR1133291.1 hypothetical protein [Bradyrhizobium iriomotense]
MVQQSQTKDDDRGGHAPHSSDRHPSLAREGIPARAADGAARALPPRVAERQDPALWSPDEVLTLGEAAALFWPRGPIREASLRTARRDGQLAVARIAGKLLTTRRAVEDMIREAMRASSESRVSRRPAKAPAAAEAATPRTRLRAKIEALVAGSPSSPGGDER